MAARSAYRAASRSQPPCRARAGVRDARKDRRSSTAQISRQATYGSATRKPWLPRKIADELKRDRRWTSSYEYTLVV
eukprot:1944738-Prymnesium_polylepis.1